MGWGGELKLEVFTFIQLRARAQMKLVGQTKTTVHNAFSVYLWHADSAGSSTSGGCFFPSASWGICCVWLTLKADLGDMGKNVLVIKKKISHQMISVIIVTSESRRNHTVNRDFKFFFKVLLWWWSAYLLFCQISQIGWRREYMEKRKRERKGTLLGNIELKCQGMVFGQTKHDKQHRSIWLSSPSLDYRPSSLPPLTHPETL